VHKVNTTRSSCLTIWQQANARCYLLFFYVRVTVLHRNTFLYNKTNRRTNFPNLFWLKIESLHASSSSSAHHRDFVNCTLGTGICHPVWSQLSSRTILVLLESCLQPVWHIPLLSVQWINSCWWTDELSETCRVSWQNKFGKLVHLVGFLQRNFLRCTVTYL